MNKVATQLSELLADMVFEIDTDISALYLYGSAITGKLRHDSDIDIALLPSLKIIKAEEYNKIFVLIAKAEDVVSQAARKICLKQEVSILNLQDKSSSVILKFNAVYKGKVIYARANDVFYRRNFENAIMGEYFDFKNYHDQALKEKYGR